MSERGPDPNKDRNDPMDFDHWKLGEAVQDRFETYGISCDGTAGIAVDLHDLLQSADRIRDDLAVTLKDATDEETFKRAVFELREELKHVQWHIETALEFLSRV